MTNTNIVPTFEVGEQVGLLVNGKLERFAIIQKRYKTGAFVIEGEQYKQCSSKVLQRCSNPHWSYCSAHKLTPEIRLKIETRQKKIEFINRLHDLTKVVPTAEVLDEALAKLRQLTDIVTRGGTQS